jgi:uncharacterized protein
MKTSLSHLPYDKQQQVLQIVETIKEIASPAKIILFGSYATGKWQQDWSSDKNIVHDYVSDYDLLVIVKDKEDDEKLFILNDRIVNKLKLRAPINLIVHSIEYVNEGLEKGQYFWTDIIKEGILLYDTNEAEFAKARELTKEEKKAIAIEYFDYWHRLSIKYLNVSINDFRESVQKNEKLNFSARNLFESTESFYSTVLLVFTGYKPKTHNLNKLRNYSKGLSLELDMIFPQITKSKYEADLFSLLNRAYIGAKYKMNFQISEKELSDLIDRIETMKEVVEKICKEKISAIR